MHNDFQLIPRPREYWPPRADSPTQKLPPFHPFAVHYQRAHKILHDDGMATSRNPQRVNKLREIAIKITSALSRATSVPEPIAIPTLASTRAISPSCVPPHWDRYLNHL